MSERYGPCERCRGIGKIIQTKQMALEGVATLEPAIEECPRCDGTGFSGDQWFKDQRDRNDDWEQEQGTHYWD